MSDHSPEYYQYRWMFYEVRGHFLDVISTRVSSHEVLWKSQTILNSMCEPSVWQMKELTPCMLKVKSVESL